MSTYYMQGCEADNEALKYFDIIFTNVQEIIKHDNIVSIELEKLLYDDDAMPNEEDFDEQIDESATINAHKKALILLEKLNDESASINIFANEKKLKQEYEKLLKAYLWEYRNSYSFIIDMIAKDEASNKEIKKFNNTLQNLNKTLTNIISDFYVVADDYAEKYEIDLG